MPSPDESEPLVRTACYVGGPMDGHEKQVVAMVGVSLFQSGRVVHAYRNVGLNTRGQLVFQFVNTVLMPQQKDLL